MHSHDDFDRHHRTLMRRKRWLRKLLRPLPRRANLARYPFLKRFAVQARKAAFLWSFKRAQVMPSLYLGMVLAFLPVYGLQIIFGLAGAFLVRGNLTVMIALQMITNPLTIVPVYGLTGWVGFLVMDALGIGADWGTPLRLTNALFVGGVLVGLIAAVLADGFWRFAAWEARAFRRRLEHLRSAR